jgi:Protein of Unknown function (DUF2784)
MKNEELPAMQPHSSSFEPRTSSFTRLRRMTYSFLAAATALLHLAFILFVLFGGFLVLRWHKLAWVHVPAAVWGVLIEFCGWYCPLTRWENFFLREAGRAGYSGGFVSHYIFPLIYPAGLTRVHELVIGALVLLVNAAIYVKVLR